MGLSESRSLILDQIGSDRFEAACTEARKKATDPDYGRPRSIYSTISYFQSEAFETIHDVSDEIGEMVWELNLGKRDKLKLILLFYESFPSYWLLVVGVDWHLKELGSGNRALFWSWVRSQLASDDPAIPQPLSYFLWCEIFEDPNWVKEAWNALVYPLPADKVLQILLINSGPVPFALKKKLYGQLLNDPKWHYYIYRGLLHSAFDYYGSIDRIEGFRILSRFNPGRGYGRSPRVKS